MEMVSVLPAKSLSAGGEDPARLFWPDHTQLPDENGAFVKNFQEHPQSILLTTSIEPLLRQRHPQGDYCIGQDSGIYWDLAAVQTDTPIKGAEAPDWFYVPGVPPLLDGKFRRSYVLWHEHIAPLVVVEFVSGDGREERDKTPHRGKFWVYEQGIRVPFYVIFEHNPPDVELYHLVDGAYEKSPPNERGHYAIAPLGVEVGIWEGKYQNIEAAWLRWWDAAGNLLLTPEERLEQAMHEMNRLREQLRASGQEPHQDEG
jgi:Uma2 family endonuclease